MAEYVEIKKGKVNPIIIADDKVQEFLDAGHIIKDISAIKEKPEYGWVYDSKEDTYSKPVEKVKVAVVSPAQTKFDAVKEKPEPTITDVMEAVKAIALHVGME